MQLSKFFKTRLSFYSAVYCTCWSARFEIFHYSFGEMTYLRVLIGNTDNKPALIHLNGKSWEIISSEIDQSLIWSESMIFIHFGSALDSFTFPVRHPMLTLQMVVQENLSWSAASQTSLPGTNNHATFKVT